MKLLSDVLKLGDGIVIDQGMPKEEELGGPVFYVEEMNRNGQVLVKFGRDVERKWRKSDEASKHAGCSRKPLASERAHVWKSSDAAVDKKIKQLIDSALPKGAVKVSVSGTIGTSLRVEIIDLATGNVGIGESDRVLELAEQSGLQLKSISKAIGMLGNTQWKLIDGYTGIDISHLDSSSWCPVSWVKRKAQQKAVNNLMEYDTNIDIDDEHTTNLDVDVGINNEIVHKLIEETMINEECSVENDAYMSILARSIDQIDVLCDLIDSGESLINKVVIDFLEIDGIREAVSKLRKSHICITIATPRIVKAGEEEIWKTLLRLEPDGLLIRSAGLIYRVQQMGGTGATVDVGEGQQVQIPDLIGDFSLNTVNTLMAAELLDYGGLSRITAVYDLSANAITDLAKSMKAAGSCSQLEVVVHAHLPIFHTEHCVFSRFLSKGNSYLDCGHVCTHNTIHLRDQTGKDNLVLADMGCRNTVFSAEAQSGVHSMKEWIESGLKYMRIELVDEGKNDVKKIINGYEDILRGKKKANDVGCFENCM